VADAAGEGEGKGEGPVDREGNAEEEVFRF